MNHRNVLKQVICLGVFFLMLTLTYMSFSTIITFIYEQHEGYEYLGPLLLMVNNAAFMFCIMLVPSVQIHYKTQFSLGGLFFTLNYILEMPFMFAKFGVFPLIIGAILGGVGAALIWVPQGGFMIALL